MHWAAAEFRFAGDGDEMSRSQSRTRASSAGKYGRGNNNPPMYRFDVLDPVGTLGLEEELQQD